MRLPGLTALLIALPALAAAEARGPVVESSVEISSRLPDLVVPVDPGPGLESHAAAASGEPAILYLNGCFGGGCRVGAGGDSAVDNRSSLLKGAAQLPSYPYGEQHFQQVVDCVREIYEPFNIAVTDQDPGNVPHFETVIAGMPTSLGFPAEVAGAAPFSCGVIPNAMSFVFPARLDGDARRICETVAHEAAHPWGLEHAFLCEDAMTYLDGCGHKSFADVDTMCGEDQSRPCECGNTGTQNSFQKLLERFGPADPTPPSVALLRPGAGQQVEPGFSIEVAADDDSAIAAVELWIDGQRVTTLDAEPWKFRAPDLPSGPHTIQVRAIDDMYTPSSATAEVLVGSACAADDDCQGAEVCARGVCMLGPAAAGGLGTPCQSSDQCESQMCLDVAPSERLCTVSCASDPGACPAGFECQAMAAGDPLCVPMAGGCQATGSGRLPALWLLVAASLLAGARRRRHQPS